MIKRKTEERRQLKLLVTNEQLKERYNIEVSNRYEVLSREESLEEEEELDRDWRILQTALTEPTKEIVPKQERRRRQKWMTEEILDKMDERRRNKDRNTQRYSELNAEIRGECDRAKAKLEPMATQPLRRAATRSLAPTLKPTRIEVAIPNPKGTINTKPLMLLTI